MIKLSMRRRNQKKDNHKSMNLDKEFKRMLHEYDLVMEKSFLKNWIIRRHTSKENRSKLFMNLFVHFEVKMNGLQKIMKVISQIDNIQIRIIKLAINISILSSSTYDSDKKSFIIENMIILHNLKESLQFQTSKIINLFGNDYYFNCDLNNIETKISDIEQSFDDEDLRMKPILIENIFKDS